MKENNADRLQMLRVDLNRKTVQEGEIYAEKSRRTIGGTGIGAQLLYEEVAPGVQWSDPENRLTDGTTDGNMCTLCAAIAQSVGPELNLS